MIPIIWTKYDGIHSTLELQPLQLFRPNILHPITDDTATSTLL